MQGGAFFMQAIAPDRQQDAGFMRPVRLFHATPGGFHAAVARDDAAESTTGARRRPLFGSPSVTVQGVFTKPWGHGENASLKKRPAPKASPV